MSTRTIIFFHDEVMDDEETDTEKITKGIPIYKHNDGYPSNTLLLLRSYLHINKVRIDDISYLAAGFLRYVERYNYKIPDELFDENGVEIPVENYTSTDPYTGYGLFEMDISPSLIDGWEDYYYKVTQNNIYCYKGRFSSSEPLLLWKTDMESFLQFPLDVNYFHELEEKILEKITP